MECIGLSMDTNRPPEIWGSLETQPRRSQRKQDMKLLCSSEPVMWGIVNGVCQESPVATCYSVVRRLGGDYFVRSRGRVLVGGRRITLCDGIAKHGTISPSVFGGQWLSGRGVDAPGEWLWNFWNWNSSCTPQKIFTLHIRELASPFRFAVASPSPLLGRGDGEAGGAAPFC
jgi:hypothetical protein